MCTGREKSSPSIAWSIWVAVVTVMTGLFLAWLSSQLMIDELVKRGTSKIYAPTLSLVYPRTGQKNITVLTIDDIDLKEYGLNWPVPLDYYQRLIDKLLKHQPKAIFLDVLFLDDKPVNELKSLAAAACRSTKAGVPFFLATFGTESLSSDSERFLFAQRIDGIPCVMPVQSNLSPDALDQSQWSYPLVFQSPESTDQAQKESPESACSNQSASVALTLYRRFFKSECPEDVAVPLALIWGSKAAPTNVQTMVQRSSPTAPLTPACRGEWSGWEVLPGARMFVELATREKFLPVCPYNQVLPVRTLKGYGFSSEELHEALTDKIIMIGADLKAVGDNVFSPLHGRLPGIHVHAMALDNLISFGGKYKQSGDFEVKELYHSKSNKFIFISVVLISFSLVFWRRFEKIKLKLAELNMSDELKEKSLGDSSLCLRLLNQRYGEKINIYQLFISLISHLFMLLLFPFLFVLGAPRGYTTELHWYQFKLKIIGLGLFVALGILMLFIGYGVFNQGPLSIIEYVLFFVGAHFLHLGEKIAERSYQWFHALQSHEPWLAWAHLGKEADKESEH